MAFKGVLPSELWDKYDCEGGQQKLLLDLHVASEIQDRITEATQTSKTNGKDMVARRNQRREQRQLLSDSDGIDMLKSIGVAFDK
tara:strand:- start:177 stop:431 length:255 start_codon:yes stop_codon:yes gene_type:complete